MKKATITLGFILILAYSSYSQADPNDIKLFDEYIGEVSLDHLDGIYETPLTYNQNSLDMGGMKFMDAGKVSITFNSDDNSGILVDHTFNAKVNFEISIEGNNYKVSFEKHQPEKSIYNGQIIALDENKLRILYFDRVSQLQMAEFKRIEN